MLIVNFKFKNYVKFINNIKLISLWIFVLFNIYLFQSCITKRTCGGGPNIDCYLDLTQDLRVDKDGNGLIEIYTIEDLNNIKYNLAGTSWKTSETDLGISTGCPNNNCIGYELKNDLDFNKGDDGLPTKWSSNYAGADKVADGWVPIGDCGADSFCYVRFDFDYTKDNRPFSASFNGNGFVIKNLYIKSNKLSTAGLFGYVSGNNSISNIGVTNFWISISSFGDSFSGGLVGYMSVGGITNSYAIGSSSSYSYDLFSSSGGLVGDMSGGNISNSYATCSSSSNGSSGGLVGNMDRGNISNSYATCSTSSSVSSGGLVGRMYGGGISNSYATGSSSGSHSGGLVGDMNGGSIYNSYATGSSSSNSYFSFSFSGGLVGNMDGGNISYSFATGWSSSFSSSSSSSSGGLVGVMFSEGNISNSYATGWSYSFSTSTSTYPVFNYSSSSTGGLVGVIYAGGSITNSYATGWSTSSSSSSSSISSTGGLVGYIFTGGIIINSYATGSSTSSSSLSSFSGSLVGYMPQTMWVTNSFATGSTTSTSSSSLTSFSGGLVGKMLGESISNSFWNKDSKQIINNSERSFSSKLGVGWSTIAITGLTPLITSELQATSGSVRSLGTKAFDFIGNGSYPKLCITPLRAGRQTCTSADYLENVLRQIVFLK